MFLKRISIQQPVFSPSSRLCVHGFMHLRIHSQLVLQFSFSILETFRYPHCPKAEAQTPIMVIMFAIYRGHQPSLRFPSPSPRLSSGKDTQYLATSTPTASIHCGPSGQKPYSSTGRKEIVISRIKVPTPEHRPPFIMQDSTATSVLPCQLLIT